MKLKAIYNQLTEGLSKVLYHRTSVGSVLSILQDNEFRLTTSVGTKSDARDTSGGRWYFLSTARTLSSGYYRSTSGLHAFITLDGDKLQQRYKGYPVDYWQYSTKPEDWSSPERYSDAMSSKEMEDRIVHDKSTIPDAKKYITEISVVIPTNFKTGEVNLEGLQASKLRKLVIEAKKNNIPIYLYKNFSDLRAHNVGKAIDIDAIDLSGHRDITRGYISREDDRRLGHHVSSAVKAYYANGYDGLDADTRKFVLQLRSDYKLYRDEMIRSVAGDIKWQNSQDNKWGNQITKLMQKHKFTSVDQFIDMLHEKWKDIKPTSGW